MILNRCPQGSTVPNKFDKEKKSSFSSDTLRSLRFISPLADTSLSMSGHSEVMKCYAVV